MVTITMIRYQISGWKIKTAGTRETNTTIKNTDRETIQRTFCMQGH